MNNRNKQVIIVLATIMLLSSCGNEDTNSNKATGNNVNGSGTKSEFVTNEKVDETDKIKKGDTKKSDIGGDGGTKGELSMDIMAETAETAISTEGTHVDTNIEYDEANPFILTAGEWNDNNNWGFFANLINNDTIAFPSFGLNPSNRIEVIVTNNGNPVPNKTVELVDYDKSIIWTAKTDKNGKAYMFYNKETQSPKYVMADDIQVETFQVTNYTSNIEDVPRQEKEREQDKKRKSGSMYIKDSVEIEINDVGEKYTQTEIMFILDTTSSMSDEMAYLQKDFASIAEDIGNDNITFSVNFYRDEGDDYVTKTNVFTSDIQEIQSLLNNEQAAGGGDMPEAVADILEETITNGEWSVDTNKIAFLIFDAPPHKGTDSTIQKAVQTAAEKGIHIVPVVASNSDRETELFGRALAVMTNSNYVFLTDDSGVGESHLEPIIGDYSVELLHDIIVRNIQEISGD